MEGKVIDLTMCTKFRQNLEADIFADKVKQDEKYRIIIYV